MIFLSITGSFTAAVIYDKREKKRAQRKWCRLVEHVAKEPLEPRSMPRRLTVFLEAPPADGLRTAQDHFKDYVKPILVASGLDWEFTQGRKEGDVRAELAEKIRNLRLPPSQRVEESVIERTRRDQGVKEFDGPRGDIVIGRHTWKEYVRGLHEGWLGPLHEPPKSTSEKSLDEARPQENEAKAPVETLPGITIHSTTDSETSSDAKSSATTPPSPADDKPKKLPQPPPFIATSDYKFAPDQPDLPAEFDPSAPISFPHILGFLNTPVRLYRFLNRRALADSIGRETAAIILANYRPYNSTSTPGSPSVFSDTPAESSMMEEIAEQQLALIEEEKQWHKSARVRVEGEPERTWLEPVVLDPRIAARMRRFELSPEDEARVKAIVVPEEEIEGWVKGSLRKLGRSSKEYLGFGKKKVASGVEGEEILE